MFLNEFDERILQTYLLLKQNSENFEELQA